MIALAAMAKLVGDDVLGFPGFPPPSGSGRSPGEKRRTGRGKRRRPSGKPEGQRPKREDPCAFVSAGRQTADWFPEARFRPEQRPRPRGRQGSLSRPGGWKAVIRRIRPLRGRRGQGRKHPNPRRFAQPGRMLPRPASERVADGLPDFPPREEGRKTRS